MIFLNTEGEMGGMQTLILRLQKIGMTEEELVFWDRALMSDHKAFFAHNAFRKRIQELEEQYELTNRD